MEYTWIHPSEETSETPELINRQARSSSLPQPKGRPRQKCRYITRQAYAKAQARARKAPPTVQTLPAIWPAALKEVEEAAGAPVPMIAAVVGAATRGVETARGVDEMRAEEDFLGVEVTRVDEDVMAGVEVEVTSVVLVLVLVLVLVGVGV